MIHILKMRYFSPCKERFFSREGNFGQRRQMEKKKKKNWEDKEGNIFTEEKEGQGKGAIVTWLDIKGTTRTGKNAGSACIAIYANFLVIALISIFLEQKVPCFMFYKKEYMMYIIRLKRILYITNVLGLCNSFCKTNLNHSPVVDFSFTYTCVIIICWPQNRMMYKCPWTLQQILQKQSSSFYSG